MGQPQVVPSNISKMQNRVFGPMTFRDIGVVVAVVAVTAVVFQAVPGPVILKGLLAVLVAGIGLGAGFIHLLVDMEPLEKFVFTWYNFSQSHHEMVWKKEIIDENGFYASDSTQSFFPFHISKSGILVYHNNGGGAAMMKVEGVDYQLLSEGERDVIIATFGDFIDSMNFPVQILIKTTPLDLRDYISDAKKYSQNNTAHAGLAEASADYIDLLERYQSADFIYNKAMYIILPYTAEAEMAGNKSLGMAGAANMDTAKANSPLNALFKKRKKEDLDLSALQTKEFSEDFTIKILKDRQQTVSQFLSGVQGVSCRAGTLPEYVELFYYFFNINESNIRSILEKEPTDNLASNTPEYQAIRQRAEQYKQQASQNSVYNLDDIL